MDSRQYKFFTPTRCIFGEGCSRQAGERAREVNGTNALVVTDKGLVAAGVCGSVLSPFPRRVSRPSSTTRCARTPPKRTCRRAALSSTSVTSISSSPSGAGARWTRQRPCRPCLSTTGISSSTIRVETLHAAPPAGHRASHDRRDGGRSDHGGRHRPDQSSHRKIDVVSPFMAPRVSLVDPELTYSLPPAMTAATGMDALTHSIEGYTATLASSLTDAIHIRAIELLGRYPSARLPAGRGRRGATSRDDGKHDGGGWIPQLGAGRRSRADTSPGGTFRHPSWHCECRHAAVRHALQLPVVPFEARRHRPSARGRRSRFRSPRSGRCSPFGRHWAFPRSPRSRCRRNRLRTLARDALGRNSNCVTNPRQISEEEAVGEHAAAPRRIAGPRGH